MAYFYFALWHAPPTAARSLFNKNRDEVHFPNPFRIYGIPTIIEVSVVAEIESESEHLSCL